MLLEETIQLQQWINNLQDPQRLIIFFLVYAGIPLLCIILICIERKLEEKRLERIYYERKKENSIR